MVFIDEMGKVLEGATRDGSDVYFLQQLAEIASRSEGRLIVVGILHQAFEEYAHRLSREMREEWSKIQGRFVDLPVNTAADEQIGLLGRAIESDHNPAEPTALSKVVATFDAPGHIRGSAAVTGGLLAAAPGGIVPIGANFPPEIRPEPTEHLRVPEFLGTQRVPRFSAPR